MLKNARNGKSENVVVYVHFDYKLSCLHIP